MSDTPEKSDDKSVDLADLDGSVEPETLRRVLQNLSLACVIADYSSREILFENATFFQWFPPKGDRDGLLTERLPDLNQAKAEERLKKWRPISFEAETKPGGRESSVVRSQCVDF